MAYIIRVSGVLRPNMPFGRSSTTGPLNLCVSCTTSRTPSGLLRIIWVRRSACFCRLIYVPLFDMAVVSQTVMGFRALSHRSGGSRTPFLVVHLLVVFVLSSIEATPTDHFPFLLAQFPRSHSLLCTSGAFSSFDLAAATSMLL